MAKLLPPDYEFTDPKRNGERLVYNWLSNDSVPGYAFYSVLQKNQPHKLIGEIDFLYLCSRGLLCFEIKGGKDIYRKDRKWYSLNKKDQENEINDPFIQAQKCMYALKDYFKGEFVRDSEISNCLIGFGVIFPECKFTGSGNDLLTEVLFDNRRMLNDFHIYIDDVFEYWEQTILKKHNKKVSLLSDSQIERIVNVLRGDFRVIPSMNLEMQHIQKQMLEMTEEQYYALDSTKYNARVIIQGGAGTGKTLLALEKYRQSVSQNKKTLYLCFNRNMVKYARFSLKNEGIDNINVYTFHSYISHVINKPDSFTMSVPEISELFINSMSSIKNETHDYLIIDEAQDLINSSAIEVFDKILSGGIKNGKWIMFLDQNQNIFNKNEDFNITLDYINEICTPSYYPLNRNCRNTEQIAKETSIVSLVPPSRFLKIKGPTVKKILYTDVKELKQSLRKEILSLLSGGASSSDIVLLSRYKYNNSAINKIKLINNMDISEYNDILQFKPDQLNYYTVQSFKGLESNIVFYIDIDGFKNENDRYFNYVAMSRAKFLLYIFFPKKLKSEYDNVTAEGLDLL